MPSVGRVPGIVSRAELAKYASELAHGKDGESIAVEVGVYAGSYSAVILASWPGRLIGVDPYIDRYDEYDPTSYGLQSAREAAGGLYRKFRDRAELWEVTSLEAALRARKMGDGTAFRFVYIDGDHRPEAVLLDLAAWWPVVEPGGILAGHDFSVVGAPWAALVGPTVLGWCDVMRIPVVYVVPETPIWSWFVVKED